MKYSIVNNKKVEAYKGGRGSCILCKAETIAKYGTIKINHWAHKSKFNCDSWWENETGIPTKKWTKKLSPTPHIYF